MSSARYERTLRLTLPYLRGKDVLAVQGRLSKQIATTLPVNGIFDHHTREAVKLYQQDRKDLTCDGIVGLKTWGSLFGTTPAAKSPASQPPEARDTVAKVAVGAKLPGQPKLSAQELDAKIAHLAVDRKNHPLIVVGIRGYFGKFGNAPGNERGIYDDTLFVHSTGREPVGFNGNTDPSRSGLRKDGTGLAVLKTGLWCVYKFDIHKKDSSNAHPALCQRADVTIARDGGTEHTGGFGINIHKGGRNSTSSEGCQTIHPDQWDEFYNLCKQEAIRHFGEEKWKNKFIPYALIDAEENEKIMA